MRTLLSRVGRRLCAVPIEHVSEVLRPLPIAPLAQLQPFVLGAAVIRGEAVPVIDAGQLLGEPLAAPARFISLKLGARGAALAVGEVLGLRELDELRPLAPLLSTDQVAALEPLDRELLVVLNAARLLPEDGPPGAPL